MKLDYKSSFWWIAPEYFNKWRVFPRAFVLTYLYILLQTVLWFMGLPDPSVAQSGFVSVIVGAGAAWFGLYVSSGPFSQSSVDPTRMAQLEEENLRKQAEQGILNIPSANSTEAETIINRD